MKEKLNCEIIQDLLPNYLENLTSDYTNESIENHIKDCPKCKESLEMMNSTVTSLRSNNLDHNTDKFKKFLRKIKTRNALLGVLGTFLICLLFGIGYIQLYLIADVPVASKYISVDEVYQLSDGRIHYEISTNLGYDILNSSEEETNEYIEIQFYRTPRPKVGDAIRITRNDAIQLYNEETGTEITKIYYKGKDNNDTILIWEKGMEIPKAPEKIEALYKK